MTKTAQWVRGRSAGFYTVVALLLVAAAGFVDFRADAHLNLVLVYFIPILFAEIWIGARVGVFVSVLSIMAWTVSNGPFVGVTTGPMVHTANIISTLAIFLAANGTMAMMRAAGLRETHASRTDRLSGVLNRLGFTEILHREMARARRHKKVFTLVYFNADNFKSINASHGHPTGDHVIEMIGRALHQGMRSSDTVARLERDEFIALLPEMDADASHLALVRIQKLLNDTMHNRNWKITFRAGAMTFLESPKSSEELLRQAERLQFVMRAANKNTIKAVAPTSPSA